MRVYDPRGVVVSPKCAVAEYDYDVLGRPLQSRSPDAGTRWSLVDARGRPFLRWDAGRHGRRVKYDLASREADTDRYTLPTRRGIR
ncbi:MAG: hypothetical protein IV100_11845 [Myxococcales bacterium]|nr:hypothetical protein [Myxococcales bacterium]